MPVQIPRLCPICGPKLSLFCMVISGWGIIFLGLLGVFFYVETGILFTDVMSESLEKDLAQDKDRFLQNVSSKYHSCAYNCWIAAALYVVTLVLAMWQNKWNNASALS